MVPVNPKEICTSLDGFATTHILREDEILKGESGNSGGQVHCDWACVQPAAILEITVRGVPWLAIKIKPDGSTAVNEEQSAEPGSTTVAMQTQADADVGDNNGDGSENGEESNPAIIPLSMVDVSTEEQSLDEHIHAWREIRLRLAITSRYSPQRRG
eukprot:scaffold210296_cov38-Prasinocladus_malaysianus.AAC.2